MTYTVYPGGKGWPAQVYGGTPRIPALGRSRLGHLKCQARLGCMVRACLKKLTTKQNKKLNKLGSGGAHL